MRHYSKNQNELRQCSTEIVQSQVNFSWLLITHLKEDKNTYFPKNSALYKSIRDRPKLPRIIRIKLIISLNPNMPFRNLQTIKQNYYSTHKTLKKFTKKKAFIKIKKDDISYNNKLLFITLWIGRICYTITFHARYPFGDNLFGNFRWTHQNDVAPIQFLPPGRYPLR